MSHYQIVYVSLLELIVSLAFLLSVFLFVFFHKKASEPLGSLRSRDWTVPSVDKYADGDSLFHTWDPRFKIFTLTVYSFFVVSLGNIFISAIALLSSIMALIISGLPWERSIKRIKAISGFLMMFLLILPFTSKGFPGETLIVFGGFESFPFHSNGFWKALNIAIKASAVALLMEPLLSTSRFPVTLLAVSRLGMPVVICQMILLSNRYIHVFLQEMKRMYRGMKVRGFERRTNIETMRSLGNFLGMLIVRSFDRTQRVYDAMLSRGYSGVFPTYIEFSANRADWHKSILGLVFGTFLLGLDFIINS